MPYFGTMHIDASGSDFDIQFLESANFEADIDSGVETTAPPGTPLTISDIPGGSDVAILLKGSAGSFGTWKNLS